jgi:HK97 family phage portal protein
MLNRFFDTHTRSATELRSDGSPFAVDNWRRFTPGTYSLWSGINVNDDTALALPAFSAGLGYISNTIAGWDLEGYRGRDLLPANPSILERPNPLETRFVTIGQMVRSLILRGDCFCLLGGFNGAGYPTMLQVLHPDHVFVYRDMQQVVHYQVLGVEIPRNEILHLKANSLPHDLRGRGAIRTFAEALGEQLAVTEYGAKFFREGAVPSLFFSPKESITDPEEVTRFLKAWQSDHGNRSRAPAMPSVPMDVQKLSFTPEEAQFITGREFGLTQVALMLNLEPEFLGAPGSQKLYQNMTALKEMTRERALRPWSQLIEEGLSDLLVRGTKARFDLDGWMRSASKLERFQTWNLGITGGYVTPEYAALEEGLPEPPEKVPDTPAEEVAELVENEAINE